MTPPYSSTAAPPRQSQGSRRHNAPKSGLPEIPATDGERLMRFRQHRDEAAFHDVVRAHAPLVWGICWQVLRHREDVEDAFQATFLILARKASSIRATESAAGWLYRVAFRTALAARQRRRRLGIEPMVDDPPGPLEDQLTAIERSEQCETLLEELHALAARYRQPLVLCYLEGRTRQEAADELGMTLASVKGRLARGLRLLRTRMAHRGLALSSAAALLVREMAVAKASVATAPIAQAAALGASFAWTTSTVGVGTSTAGGTVPAAITLARKGILAMKFAAAAKPAIGLLAVGMTAGALALAAGERPATGNSSDSTAIVDLVASDDAVASTSETLAPSTFVAADAPGAPVVENGELALPFVAGAPAQNVLIPTDAAGPVRVTQPFPGGSADLQPAAAEAPVPRPQEGDVLIASPPGATLSVGAGQLVVDDGRGTLRLQAPAPQNAPLPQIAALAPQPPASTTVMKLEHQYWTLKGSGLRRKAEALQLKAQSMQEHPGVVTKGEIAETIAEAELTEAEAILCDARAQQLEDTFNQRADEAVGSIQRDDFPTPTSDATFSIGIAPAAETPTQNPPSDPAAPINDVAAQLRSQFDELRKENAELRRQVDELRHSHINLNSQPTPIR